MDTGDHGEQIDDSLYRYSSGLVVVVFNMAIACVNSILCFSHHILHFCVMF